LVISFFVWSLISLPYWCILLLPVLKLTLVIWRPLVLYPACERRYFLNLHTSFCIYHHNISSERISDHRLPVEAERENGFPAHCSTSFNINDNRITHDVQFCNCVRHFLADKTCLIIQKFKLNSKIYGANEYKTVSIQGQTLVTKNTVCHPLKASILCSVQRARAITLSIFLILLATNSHFLWTVHVSDTYLNESRVCEAVPKFWFLISTPVISPTQSLKRPRHNTIRSANAKIAR
jgi:hypothetical protein